MYITFTHVITYARAAGLKCKLLSGLVSVIAFLRGDLVCECIYVCMHCSAFIFITHEIHFFIINDIPH